MYILNIENLQKLYDMNALVDGVKNREEIVAIIMPQSALTSMVCSCFSYDLFLVHAWLQSSVIKNAVRIAMSFWLDCHGCSKEVLEYLLMNTSPAGPGYCLCESVLSIQCT